MDMVLYSLIKKEIDNAPLSKVESVDGNKIEFVDALPSNLEKNTLYFILGEYNGKDKINVGGRGIQCIVYNGDYIDYGILNNNCFFNGYDFNRGHERVLRTSTDGTYITVNNTIAEEPIIMSLNLNEESTIEIVEATEETVYEYETVVLDGNLNWQNSAPLGDCREFKCIGFDEKPIYLTEDGLYDETIFMPFNEENVTVLDVDSDFTINSKAEPHGECIFVHNGVLYIHICSTSVRTSKGMTYAKSLKQYLTDNPITLKIRKI